MDAPPMENPPARALIIDTAWLGDVVFTTALIGGVHRLWPSCELHVLVAPRGEPLLHGHPFVSRLWVFDKYGKDRGGFGLRRTARALRQQKFDLILNAHPSLRSRLLTKWVAAPVRVGYQGFLANFCFTRVIANDLAVEPDHAQRRLALLRALGYDVPTEPLSVSVAEADRLWAADFLTSRQLSSCSLLGLIPGSAWETKHWPLRFYAELAQRWIDSQHGSVIVFGGHQERTLTESICRSNPEHVLPIVNEPLPHVAALLSQCSHVVGNDTGVTLLAAAVNGPHVIALYGCTQINYHFPPPHVALHAGVPCCLPRTGHGAHRCLWAEQAWCMEQLTVDKVWNEISS
jgi:lipopolysaccharide heptosyltransferase II